MVTAFERPYAWTECHYEEAKPRAFEAKRLFEDTVDMTIELLEALLHQNESETLDFKSGQYQFEQTTPERQGEILKDILAFANAWRQTDAYILIGVEEKRDARSVIVGLNGELSNRNLQQFVTSKTNRPIAFSYSTFSYEDKEVGVLHIPLQDRPVYLLKDFGRLRANLVYIRRSETTGEASPDEIVRMASTAGRIHRDQPTLALEYGDPKTRSRWGQGALLKVLSCAVPARSRIPEYGATQSGPFGLTNLSMENRNFYRDAAHYLREHFFVTPVAVVIDNTATALAEDVIVTIVINTPEVTVRSKEQMPVEPSTDRTMALLGRRLKPSKVSVSRFENHHEVVIQLGNVQPGTTMWAPEPFFIGARKHLDISAEVRVSANNLRIPSLFHTTLSVKVEERALSVAEIKELAESFH